MSKEILTRLKIQTQEWTSLKAHVENLQLISEKSQLWSFIGKKGNHKIQDNVRSFWCFQYSWPNSSIMKHSCIPQRALIRKAVECVSFTFFVGWLSIKLMCSMKTITQADIDIWEYHICVGTFVKETQSTLTSCVSYYNRQSRCYICNAYIFDTYCHIHPVGYWMV